MVKNQEKKMQNNYVCGCDIGSTYGKAVIMDMDGQIIGSAIVRSKLDPGQTAEIAVIAAIADCDRPELTDRSCFGHIIGTGYGRNRVEFASENISEISCHAMGVHVTDPQVRTIIDIGGQDMKGISIDADGGVAQFAMNDKCAAGTGRFFESMIRVFDLSFEEFSALSLRAKKVVAISSQCSVFAESEVVSLVAQKHASADIAAGIQSSVAKRCFTLLKSAGVKPGITMTGGCAKNLGLKKALEKVLRTEIVSLPLDPQLMGALGAAEFARRKSLAEANAA
jgi:predicted CoA-substrate-specific enzyme activase